jgi:UDP-4-amino-4,6-dideoxy-N-acetyl-beta-L-altrosamine transaminase
MIPYGRQNINAADIDAVVAVLQSDWLTQGPAIPAFEAALSTRCGVTHGIAVSNATAALHLACLALEVGPGDIAWTTPNTFVASANCARYCGAEVDFVDIDPTTFNLCPLALADKLRLAKAEGRLPKVVIPVHFAGLPCDMAEIARLSEEYGFRIIEDASHAVGAHYQGQPTGNCRYSDVTVFSFHPVKIITTGEGGMALTANPDLANRLRLLRSHGITREPGEMTGASEGPWYYQQLALGFNYRMTDLQAALGSSQLTRLDNFLSRRRQLVARYDMLLADLPVTRQQRPQDRKSAHHLYVVRLAGKGSQRLRIFEALRSAGIGVNVHYIPVHLQPDYLRLGFARGYCPSVEQYYDEAISLPLHPDLTEHDQDFIVATLEQSLS